MTAEKDRIIVVTGATGLQGRAVTQQLLLKGFHVRAVTRNPGSKKAQALAKQGAALLQADMAESASLVPVFEGAYGVFSVQNPVLSGVQGEIRQGKNVADIAKQVGIAHLVYSSSGTGARGTGVPSWESKLVIEDYLRSLQLPLTIFRPMAFMEIMTEKKFFPAVSTWQTMAHMLGKSCKVGWISTHDYGFIVAKAFAEPDGFLGKQLQLVSDVHSIEECRTIYRQVMGKPPFRLPIPVWLFERLGFVGQDLTRMWHWLQTNPFSIETHTTLALHPGAMNVLDWLMKQKSV